MKPYVKLFNKIGILFLVILFSGCATTSKEMVKLEETSLKERQIQSRIYNTLDEKKVLSSSIETLQDMGFNIDEINRQFGVVTSSKTRDARETGQQIGLFVLAVLFGANIMDSADPTQIIRTTVVTTPKAKSSKDMMVRVTLQRVMKNSKGLVIGVENIKDEKIFQAFFDKLSKSIFLEAQNI